MLRRVMHLKMHSPMCIGEALGLVIKYVCTELFFFLYVIVSLTVSVY